jgi:two-component system NarL family sensor kinase
VKAVRSQLALHRAAARLRGRSDPGVPPAREVARLRVRLAVAEATLLAIRAGEVDTVRVAGRRGPQVFTLEGADHVYRVLIESMNEGALTLTTDKTILYANRRFAHMVKVPLEQVIGSSFLRFLSVEDRAILRLQRKATVKSGSQMQVLLTVGDGTQMPVQISLRSLDRPKTGRANFGMVVTDMTEARRSEEMLRALSQRVVQAQEVERGRVALELHDNITQQLIAVLFRSQALADSLSARQGPAKREAVKLRELLGQTAEEVERISRNLRPSVLEHLGLGAALRDTCTEFERRTGVAVKLTTGPLAVRLPPDTELALYRILQVALKNVEQHAGARHVMVSLTQQDTMVFLSIVDDGVGFDPNPPVAERKTKGGLGLFSMRERATYVGGAFQLKSGHRAGTEIEVRIPLPTGLVAAG